MRGRRTTRTGRALAGALAAWLLGAPTGVPVAWAGPSGEVVERGRVGVERDGKLTLITASDGSVIRWEGGFDIWSDETVRFLQPHSEAVVFNKDLTYDPSHLDGTLLANGIVYILNPAGIFFGGEALVRVNGLVAAAGDLSEEEAGRGLRLGGRLEGSVVNRGRIEAASVALLGRNVANHGSIEAPDGLIALVAGERVVLRDRSGHVAIHVDGGGAPDPGVAGVENTGTLDAAGGRVSLTAGDVYSLAINHTGITRARDVTLEGTGEGLVQVSGTIDASDARSGQRGGDVRVLGERIAVDGALIDASGAAGGGSIHVGGGLRGEGPERNAARTWVGPDSVLRADALESGDGGEVIVWADERTAFLGAVSARGGAQGGDGGFAEISGHRLDAPGDVDLSAPAGESGTLLYDPQDIQIVGGTGDGSDDPDADGGTVSGDAGDVGEVLFGDVGDGSTPFVITEAEIEGTDADIVLEATNSITVTGTFDNDADGGGGLDPGTDVVLLLPGNSLTLRTRNDTDDEVGSAFTPGIDLTEGGAQPDLTWKVTAGGSVLVRGGNTAAGPAGSGEPADVRVGRIETDGRTGNDASTGRAFVTTQLGSVTVGSIDTSGVNGGNAGSVRVRSFQEGDVTVTGDLIALGSDEPGAPAMPAGGGNGGIVEVDTGIGDVVVMGAIDTSGGAGAPSPDPGNVPAGTGGNAGSVLIQSGDGSISVGDITGIGGAGDEMDGIRAGIRVLAGTQTETGTPGTSVTLNGSIVSTGEGNFSVFDTRIVADDSIDTAGQGGPHIVSDSSVTLQAPTVGTAGAIEVEGAGEEGSALNLTLGVLETDTDPPAAGDADVAISGAGFETIVITQANSEADVDVAVNGGGAIDIDGAAGASTVVTADTSGAGSSFVYALVETDADIVLPAGGKTIGGDVTLVASGDLVAQGAGTHLGAEGDVSLDFATIGESQTLEIAGSGTPENVLDILTRGRADVAVTTAGFGTFAIEQRDAGADIDVTQAGGDLIDIDGTPGAGGEPGTSTIVDVDTTGNDASFFYEVDDGNADVVIQTGTMLLGGDGAVLTGGDIVIGDAPGVAIQLANGSGSTLRLEADFDTDGEGAIVDGVAGPGTAEIDLLGGAADPGALVFAGNGIGTEDEPLVLRGGGTIAGLTRQTGGIFVENVGSGDLVVGEVEVVRAPPVPDPPPVFGGLQVSFGTDDVALTNTAGDIRLEEPVGTFGSGGAGNARFEVTQPDAEIVLAVERFVPDPTPANPMPEPVERRAVLTVGSQTYAGDVRLAQSDQPTELFGIRGIRFEGSIDADPALMEAPDLILGAAGRTVLGDGQGDDAIGAEAPLGSLEITRVTVLEGQDLEEPVTEIHAASIHTERSQAFGNRVELGGDVDFMAGTSVEFEQAIDGPGAAVVNAGLMDPDDAEVALGGSVGMGETGPLGGFAVNTPGSIVFGEDAAGVHTAEGGIHLNPAGRATPSPTATIYRRPAETDGDMDMDGEDPMESSGPTEMEFVTTGDFSTGAGEKLSLPEKVSIEAANVTTGDVSTLELDIDAQSWTILGRDPAPVQRQGGGNTLDGGTDIVTNELRSTAAPVWDGNGTAPTIFTRAGGIDAPGGLDGINVRMIDFSGDGVRAEDFVDGGIALDLTGDGPVNFGNPATQEVDHGTQVAALLGPQSSRDPAPLATATRADDVLEFLRCGDVPEAEPLPDDCPGGAVPTAERALESPRARELALAYRELVGPGTEAEREAFRSAAEALRALRGTIDGAGLRRTIDTTGSRDARAYLDRVYIVLTELGLLPLEATQTQAAEDALLAELVRQLGVPGLTPEELGRAAEARTSGLRF